MASCKRFVQLAAILAALASLCSPAAAQTPPTDASPAQTAPPSHADEQLNTNTVTIMSGGPDGTYLFFAYDMSAVLDDGENLRMLPIIGKGGTQNVKDVLSLRGIDMGITQSNILQHFARTGELGANISDRLRYITRLGNEELHLLARSDINKIEELGGKTVNFAETGSGTQTIARLIFKDLKIKVKEVNMGQADAFEAMQTGNVAATVLIAGKPAGAFATLRPDPAYKLLPVPYAKILQESYLPATLTSDDYPGLVSPDAPVNTIAVSAVLAVYNWPAGSDRYRRVAKFTEALFKNIDKFRQKPRHPKWMDVNLAAEVPGWKRFAAAQEILQRESAPSAHLQAAFEKFIALRAPKEAAIISAQRRQELFRDFLNWQAQHDRQDTAAKQHQP